MSADSEVIVRAEARIGTVLRGKYRIERVLGVGGMAVVFAATHRNQKQFAVKLLHPELSIREDIRSRFLREGYAANSVKHPGAVAVLDDDTAEDGAAFLVMELLEGAPVEALWERCGSKLPLAASLYIAHQLLDVLAAAHAKGIIHRDIKPANLFVTNEGIVKVLDFGIARVRDLAATGAQATGTGVLLGTPAFMAPEQALGKANEMDAQTDLWAVGATLFTLLTGRSVHEGETGTQVLILAATTPAASLANVAPDVPAPVVALVDGALAYSKAQRWPTAEAMREAVVQTQLAVFGRRLAPDVVTSLSRGLERTFARTQHDPAPYVSSRPPVGPVAPTFEGQDRRSVAPTVGPPTVPPAPPAPVFPGYPSQAQPAPHAPQGQTSPWASQPSAAWGQAGAGQAGVPWTPSQAGLVGGTTAQPVYAEEPLAPAGVPRRRPLIFGLVFAGAAAIAAAVVFGFSALSGPAGPAAGAGPASGDPSPLTPPFATPSASASASPPAPSATGITELRPAALVPAPPPAPPQPAKPPAQPANPPPLTPPFHPPPVAPVAPATVPVVPPPVAPVAPNCKPPFYFDPAGNKVFKKECLQ
jgi:eukaryotic-like serine/threonine-protein kinase